MSGSLYAVFASPDFDPDHYANAILAGEQFQTSSRDGLQSTTAKIAKASSISSALSEPAREDISVAISKLNVGLDDVSKQLKSVVTTHHEALLVQAAGVGTLNDSLTSVRSGLDEVAASQEKLRQKIRVPCAALERHAVRLTQLQSAADILRRTTRFVAVARRLEVQMQELQRAFNVESKSGDTEAVSHGKAKRADSTREPLSRAVSADVLTTEGEIERALAKAALSVSELVALLDAPQEARPPITNDGDTPEQGEIPLRALNFVAGHIPAIEAAQTTITNEMQKMVLSGLADLNRSMLASSLQTAHNLRVLPSLVQSLVADLTDAVDRRIRVAFDMALISKDVAAKEPTPPSAGILYKSRVRTEPTNVTAPQWASAIWTRLESLVEELADCCVKVYTLEKVLQLKRDAISQSNFMDEAMTLLENKPSATFWSVLGRSLEKQCKNAAKGSSFIQQTLSAGYPRLLRLFHQFFAKITVHTDTVYSQEKQSPETILVLRALSTFESLYLSRSGNRLNEAVAQAVAGGARSPPGMGEGLGVARTVANELDAAKFDPLLVVSVAKKAQASLEMLLARTDPIIVRDRWATSLLGPVGTPQLVQNAQVASFLYNCWSALGKLEGEYSSKVLSTLAPSRTEIYSTYEHIVDPLLVAIRRELGAIIAKVHKLDLGKGMDSPLGGHSGASTYMKDLIEKINFIKTEVLSRFNVGDATRAWTTDIVRNVLRTFVLHVSIAKPLGESGKLQLTSDMTELEFALSAFITDSSGQGPKRGVSLEVIGDGYRALRAMRPLLFLDNRNLASPENTVGVPPLIVLHHILVRSPIPLPHSLHGWQESEYVRWVEEHSELEALTLVDGVLSHWEKVHDTPTPEYGMSKEYSELAHAVISHVVTKVE